MPQLPGPRSVAGSGPAAKPSSPAAQHMRSTTDPPAPRRASMRMRLHSKKSSCSASTGSPSCRSSWMHSAASSLRSSRRLRREATSSLASAPASPATPRKVPWWPYFFSTGAAAAYCCTAISSASLSSATRSLRGRSNTACILRSRLRTRLRSSMWSRRCCSLELTALLRSATESIVVVSSSIWLPMPSTLVFMLRIVSVAAMNLL
mmetsp:Transcript_18631/g.48686  ORF Transcript_18631/g.48686 Transcript_18631/m.48686 type:complete len:206 (-) Transcript_18631:126-743(-)